MQKSLVSFSIVILDAWSPALQELKFGVKQETPGERRTTVRFLSLCQ